MGQPLTLDEVGIVGPEEAAQTIYDLRREVKRLRQGLWDVYRELGFDTDGDPTPDALAYPDLVDLLVEAAKEIRRELEAE